jgi:hypothetical protein
MMGFMMTILRWAKEVEPLVLNYLIGHSLFGSYEWARKRKVFDTHWNGVLVSKDRVSGL